jgi:hypothetical protein
METLYFSKHWYLHDTTHKNKTEVSEKFRILCSNEGSQCSSVSIVSGCGLDNRVIEVQSAAGAKDFFSNLCVQTGSGAHPASSLMGTGVLSPGVKRGRGVTLTTHPHLVSRSWISRGCTSSSPPSTFMTCGGTALLYIGTNFVIYTDHVILLSLCNVGGFDGLSMQVGWERQEMHSKFWWGNSWKTVTYKVRRGLRVTWRWLLWR